MTELNIKLCSVVSSLSLRIRVRGDRDVRRRVCKVCLHRRKDKKVTKY